MHLLRTCFCIWLGVRSNSQGRIVFVMAHFFALALTFLLILSNSCATAPAAQKGAWSIKLTTSGGFAGIGTGNLSVDSTGMASYEAPTSPNQVRKSCQGKLYKDRFEPIREAVDHTRPEEWNRPDLNIAAPDAFGYKLELRRGTKAEPVTVQWYDNTKDKLPADLKRLSDLLVQQMRSGCKFGDPGSGTPE